LALITAKEHLNVKELSRYWHRQFARPLSGVNRHFLSVCLLHCT